jgi:hypothetical protein
MEKECMHSKQTRYVTTLGCFRCKPARQRLSLVLHWVRDAANAINFNLDDITILQAHNQSTCKREQAI